MCLTAAGLTVVCLTADGLTVVCLTAVGLVAVHSTEPPPAPADLTAAALIPVDEKTSDSPSVSFPAADSPWAAP